MLRKVLLFSLFGVFVFYSVGIAADPDPNLVILYAGDTQGYVEPSGCRCNSLGGLARRASMIKDMREKHKNVLLLDCSDVFSKTKDLSELRARISMRGLGLMKYDALNIADSDLVFGWDFLQEAAQKSNVPLFVRQRD